MPDTTGAATSFITFTRASSATRVNSSGLIETVSANVPLIDFDPVTLACRGLLVQEQRTNLIVRSEEFTQAAWSSPGLTVTADVVASPSGGLADTLIETTAAGGHGVFQGITLATNTQCAFSFYARRVSGTRNIRFTAYTTNHGLRALIDFDALTVTNQSYGSSVYTSGSIENAGGGWYRIVIVGIPSTTEANPIVEYSFHNGSGVAYTGNGSSGFSCWGFQAETNYSTVTPYTPWASSYIQTAASTVTRSLDYASVALSSIPYSSTEGAITIHCSLVGGNELTAYRRPFSLEGVPPGGYQIGATYVYDVTWRVTDDGTVPGKHGVAFKTDDHAVVANGGAARTGTGAFSGSSYNILRLGSTDGNWYLNGHIRNITYIPRRLTNAELQARTA